MEYTVKTMGVDATVESDQEDVQAIDLVMQAIDEGKLTEGIGIVVEVEGGRFVGDDTMFVSGMAIAKRLYEAGRLDINDE